MKRNRFLGPMLNVSISNWSVDSVERGVELERIEKSLFFHLMKLHSMDQSFKKLYYEELHIMWDEIWYSKEQEKEMFIS